MEALDRATVGVLATTISGNESLPVFQRPSGASFSPARLSASFSEDESTAVERMVLLPLEELYKQVFPARQ